MEIQTQPPFNPVYFPEGILREYEFSPEFIADARKELWAGFGETVQDLFENQSPQEVEALFDAWGQRDFEDIPSDTFATLKEIEKLHSPQHIDMESEIVGDKLIFIPPQDTPLPFVVHDNEIILGDYTIRVHLKSANNVAPAQV